MKKNSIAIIGTGKVGTAVGYLLKSAGYSIVALADHSRDALKKCAEYTGGKIFTDPAKAATMADAVFITTVDDVIASVCRDMADRGAFNAGQKVIHMSGAGGLDLLEPAKASGAFIASIHPLQAFVDVRGVIENIPGSTFSITAQPEITAWAVQIVKDLGGNAFFVTDEDKPLYHAAACMASNYFVTLMNVVIGLYGRLGLDPEEARTAFWPLVKGTVRNIESLGPEKSLTGPISRGDIKTVRRHLDALRTKFPSVLPLYEALAVFTVEIGIKNGTLPEDTAEKLLSIIKGDVQ
ncbi:MAG: DUF2520 domain-containing protein [Syntrophales bacterium]|jgi:predicted short-subunit dehydrogenase-like oxidoreductase (DUF2520 family)|nr:DUF2520 domain-containing protein [Syntrophales bacterium]MDY0044543.1 DUF2520 domain-containing protein [Syntrophales bacterium]